MQSAPAPRLSNGTKLFLAILLVVFAIVLLFGLAEGAVRVRQYLKYGYAAGFNDFYRIDDATGLRVPRAGASAGHVRINQMGFRGPELVHPKPNGMVRLAFLGASTTYCAEVSSNEAAWPHVVTETLREHFPGSSIDYVNGGVPGYSVSASIRNFEHRVRPLEPDIVVIYHATNDLSGELRQIALSQGAPAESVAPPKPSWLSRRSLLWDLVTKNLRVRAAQAASETDGSATHTFDPGEIGSEFRDDLTQLVRNVKSTTSAVVVLATFSVHLRDHQDSAARRKATESAVLYMPGFDFEALSSGYRRYNEIIREVAQAEGVLLIGDEDRIPGDPRHFVDSVHFTDLGSRAQADRISRGLMDSPEVRELLARPPAGTT